jgi:hypothetical protein
MREALRLLEEQEELHRTKLKALKRDTMSGMSDLEAGGYRTYPSGRDVFDDINSQSWGASEENSYPPCEASRRKSTSSSTGLLKAT